MKNIKGLKVFKFENGEEECVIAKNYEEAYNYYKGMVGEEKMGGYEIEEVKDWYDIKVGCEMENKQEDGTYIKLVSMLEIAEEWYGSGGYTGAYLISTTVCY